MAQVNWFHITSECLGSVDDGTHWGARRSRCAKAAVLGSFGMLSNFTRFIGAEIGRHGEIDGVVGAPLIFAALLNVPEADCAEFDAWMTDDHVPMLLEYTEWLAVRRFRLRGVQPGALHAAGRWPRLPDSPTVAEQGHPFDRPVWFGFVAPAGSPKEAIDRLAAEIETIKTSPASAEMMSTFHMTSLSKARMTLRPKRKVWPWCCRPLACKSNNWTGFVHTQAGGVAIGLVLLALGVAASIVQRASRRGRNSEPFVPACMALMGCRSWRQLVIVPLAAMLGVWGMFVDPFHVFLPTWM